jgi:predicted O-methyltransferase YrrM
MFFRIIEYVKYYFKAGSAYAIHAPFTYDFYRKVIRSKQKLPERLKEIEKQRNALLRSGDTIYVTDYGTGAGKERKDRKISQIARSYANNKRDAFLIYRIIQFARPATILELGTSLGITTMYMAKANSEAIIYSIEGCPGTARLARQNFDGAGLNINLIIGNIDTFLPELLEKELSLDFVFFDANHTKEATLKYYDLCLQKANEKTIFVFDDIYWSPGMKEAWQTIISSPQVSVSIDLYKMGIVFFKKNTAKQHFVLKY